jgi:DNA/RNA endonuclease G (NUC1)
VPVARLPTNFKTTIDLLRERVRAWRCVESVCAGNLTALGGSMKRTQFFLTAAFCLALAGPSVFAQTTYTWNQTGTASWATSTNWTPTRTTPATNDVLVFNNGATTTVTAVPTQTIGQLSVSGNTTVNLQGATNPTTLTIAGGAGTDLSVSAGSALNVNVATNVTTIAVGTGATGSISGSMTFTTAAHKLTAVDANGITFQTGSVFTAGAGFSSNAFGGGTTNSVVFASGSKYVSIAGANPFNTAGGVAQFQTGSLFSHQQTGAPSFSGRTYGDFELKVSGTASATGGSAVSIDNLTITQGTLNIGMTNTASAIKGNISIASGATLAFNSAGGTMNLSGSAAQSITNSGTLSLSTATQTINVNNANGVTLNSPVTFTAGTLSLQAGAVSTGANTLSIGANASVTRTNGYVIGNLKKTFSAAASKTFEVGTANGYSPVTANVTAGTFPADLTVVAVQAQQPNMSPTPSLQRYWTLTATGITADLTFQYLLGDVSGNENIYKVYRVSGGTPAAFPASSVNAGTHVASVTGISSFSDWTAGEFVDTTPPAVTNVTVPGNGTYATGQNLDFTVNFSENVNVTGVPRIPITLNTGGTVFANYVSGNGSPALLFRYTIGSGVQDTDGIALGSDLDLNGGSIKDLSGNDTITTLNGVPSTAGILVDGIAPSAVSITRVGSTPTNAASVDFTVTFSENIKASTVDAGDFSLASSTVAGASITGVVVSGATATVSVNTGTGDGVVDLDLVDNDSITDLAGNPLGGTGAGNGSLTNGETYTIDKTAPVVQSIVRAGLSPTNASSVSFTVTFSETVSGVDSSDFALVTSGVTGASITGVTGSGPYTVTVNSGSGDGTIGLNLVNNNSIFDTAGNLLSGGFTGEVYTFDRTNPTVVSVVRAGSNPTNAANVDFTVTFSESVSGVDASDFALATSGVTGASVTNVAGTGPYTVTVNTGTGNGSIRLDVLADGSIQDNVGNPLTTAFSTGETYTIDKTAPLVVSITRDDASPTHASTLHFTVTFNTNVNGVDTSDFQLTTSGVTGSITGVTGSGSVYDVTAGSVTGNGTLRLDLVDDDSIVSATTGTPLAGSGAGNGNFTTGEVYTVDQTPPSVSSITRVSASPTNAASVQFTVTYSEAVTGVSAQDWSLATTGVSGASVTGFTGSGTTYTVTVNTGSGDGTIRLDVVTGGTVIDAAGNLLASGFTTGETYAIDKTSPSVQSIARANADPTGAASVAFTVTFNESVSGVDAGDFALATSGVTGASITGVTGSGPYTVNVNTGAGSGTIGLNLVDDDTIADVVGNKLGGTGAGNGNFTGAVYTVQKAPLAPTGLSATSGLDSHIPLTWSAPNGASTYNVKRGTSSGSETTIASSIATTSYDDTTAVNGTLYFYVVSASNAQGEGSNSNEVSATAAAPLAAPGPVSIAVGDAKVILSWPAVPGATSYNVKRGTTTGNYTVTTNTLLTTFTDSTVTNGTPYFYVVTSQGAAESTPSSEVSGTPNTPQVLGVVISQVYGGGGNSGATLKNDFVEIFNRGTQTVSLNGWFVHYASATATSWNSPPAAGTTPTALSGTIAPGHYYLVQEAAGAGGTVNLPTADATGTIALSATGAKVALASTSTLTGTCPTGTFIADFVGYGTTANCFEGAGSTAATANTTAALRASGGCTDTNNNGADFTIGAPNPRNSATAANICGVVNNPPSITPPANPIASVAQDAAPFTVNLTGSDDGGVYNWSATPGTGLQSVSVTGGQGTATATFTVTLTAGFNGTATFTASLSDGVNSAVTQLVHIQVTGVGGNNPPIITPPANPITTVAQDPAPFTVNVSGSDDGAVFNWSATPGTGVASVSATGGQGTSTVTYTVALNAGFNGTATFTATLSDNVNPPVNQLVNINVLSAGATPDHIVISQIYGGGGNSGATFKNDFVELFNPTASPVNVSGWSIQYSSATNTGAFSGLQSLGGTIGPGEYYLIGLASGGAVGADLPVTPNVSGTSINMSGTAGKVALVNTGNVVTGPCATTQANTEIVDLIGYGTTANCNEGGTNAPAPSNTTADFRKNGGNTDTNVNGNDFITGTPNPRRTAGISEVGPAIVNTDPGTNGTNAPRDSSITVNFTEDVFVDPGWYDINCAVTGNHDDATVAPGAPDSFVITPNVNFVAGETCTVTIFKNSVHDVDTDDSAPGTDTLSADRTWSFTVSTGAAPVYPPSVHLTMGNPSNAVADTNTPNNYLMQKPEYALSYNRDKGTPNWVSWHLSDDWTCCLTRVDSFRPDPQVPPAWYRVLASDFFSSGFDRGHMCPNADRNTSTSIPINQATFLMSNMVPQAPGNNQGPWADLESYLRSLLPADEIYIVSGPAGVGGTGSNGGVTNTLANGHVTVPAQTWKVALILPKASGDDLARVTAGTRTLAVIMPNQDGIRNNDWHIYITTVKQVEALTGYNFFSNVPSAIQNAIESGTDGVNPPGAADETVSLAEDGSTGVTLVGASPSNAALTYTVVSTPAHGGLTGSGANRTYTPAPDYFGSDAFTYKVNDGTGDSNTATVTITVTPVNDPPTATDDSKSTNANTALVFNASDLTTNDSAGPANESSQVLTVTTVAPTGNTHGTVSLSAGQVTYTPASNYGGPASFTYTVCDDGVTGNSFDSLCTAATVNVTVNPLSVTHLGVSAPSSVSIGAPFNVTVSALDGANVIAGGYRGTVHFTSSGASLTLPADYTFTAADNGVHTFSVTPNALGPAAISVTDGTFSGGASLTVVCLLPPGAILPITVPSGVCAGSTGNHASVGTIGGVSTYTWSIVNGTITAGQGTTNITFTAGVSGIVSMTVTGTSSNGCPLSFHAGQTTVFAAPAATITSDAELNVCVNEQVTITASLTGAPPFSIAWSDGATQNGINGNAVSRTMSFPAGPPVSLRIVSITDAHCASGVASNQVLIFTSGAPVFTTQPQTQAISIGSNVTLTAAADAGAILYWYQGEVGDTSNRVASGTTFTTPHLHDTTKYWVRASMRCGSTDSQSAVITVMVPRHRPSNH